MVHEEIKSGYNKVVVWGDSEKITVEQIRGSTSVFGVVINRHPGFIERLFPSCYDAGFSLLNPTEEAFRQRIKKAVKIALEFSRERDMEDATQERKLIEKEKVEAQRKMELDQFIVTLKEQEHKP